MPSKLIELEIPRPGIFGVNTAASGDIMPKEYSVQSTNLVFSDEGYPEARRGSTHAHTTTLQATISAAGEQTVRQIFHTTDENGADITIFSTEEGIFRRNAAGTITNVTGALTPTTGNWKFQNLNDSIIGFQPGSAIIHMATPSSGTFANVTFIATGSETPDGDGATNAIDILVAAGRLWVLDGSNLRYSSLLDYTDFSNSTDTPAGDAGTFDLNASMLKGEDKRVALQEFNGNILIFYKSHITVFGNIWNPNGTGAGYGNTAGLATDPPMSVIENIAGVGCIARDSIAHTQNDLLFLSDQGVTSLSRVVQEKSMPLQRYSDNVRKEINHLVQQSTVANIWSVYLEGKGVYLIGSPNYRYTIHIDVSQPLPDGTYRVTLWDKSFSTMEAQPVENLTSTEDIWSCLFVSDTANYLGRMKGFKDGLLFDNTGGSTYDITYESSWTSIVDELKDRVKFPKKVGMTVKGSGAVTFDINLAFDYGSFVDANAKSGTLSLARSSQYGIATYGGTTVSATTGYYGSATSITETKVPGFGRGRIIKIKMSTTVNGENISLQRISIKAKVGKQQ